MHEVEKRELFEQERKIFEAGAQRADKRASSFSFLTWPFFIAPLIACEEFLAAVFKSAAAEEYAKNAQVGAAPQATNDHPPASDVSKASAELETAKAPAASSEAHTAQLDPTWLLAQPLEDASKSSTARSEEAVAAGGGGGGGGDDAGRPHHGPRTSIDDSSVNSLSADSHFGSSPFPSGSTLEAAQSIALGDPFSPAITGPAPLPDSASTFSNDVTDPIAPVEAVQPVLATVTDTVGSVTATGGSLSNDVAGPIAPVEAAVQPVLATVTDTVGSVTGTVGSLSNDVAGPTARVGAVQPVLTTVGAPVGTLSHDVAGTLAPVEAAVQPVLTTVGATAGTLSHDVAGTLAPVEAAVQPVLTTV